MLKAHKHWALDLMGGGYFRLGAGRSQVQILSPRLSCGWMLERAGGVPRTRDLALALGLRAVQADPNLATPRAPISRQPPTNRPRKRGLTAHAGRKSTS